MVIQTAESGQFGFQVEVETPTYRAGDTRFKPSIFDGALGKGGLKNANFFKYDSWGTPAPLIDYLVKILWSDLCRINLWEK